MGMGGTQRAAKFAKYLPCFGWKPIVVTIKNVHYYAHDDTLLTEIENVSVYRTESLDPLRLIARFKKQKDSALKDSTPNRAKSILNTLNEVIGGWIFIPDSKILWLPFAIATAFRLIKKHKIKIIYTTSPPHSVHLAGLILKFMTSAKWVTDFRDDWTGGESQACPSIIHYVINRFLEKIVLKKADKVIGMCDHLTNVLQKKSGAAKSKFIMIMNGYDRDDFKQALDIPLNRKFTITHCGSISRVSNPEPFLAAIRLLFDKFKGIEKHFHIQFIGIDIYDHLQQLLEKYQLIKTIDPIQYLPHHEALKKMMSSHLLLLTIFRKTNEEIITGKVFEYLGSGKPILLVSNEGYVANMIQDLRRGVVVNNYDINGIKDAIYHYFMQYRKGRLSFVEPLAVPQFDRKNLTSKLANVFESLIK